jgi:hypothetical protein
LDDVAAASTAAAGNLQSSLMVIEKCSWASLSKWSASSLRMGAAASPAPQRQQSYG